MEETGDCTPREYLEDGFSERPPGLLNCQNYIIDSINILNDVSVMRGHC